MNSLSILVKFHDFRTLCTFPLFLHFLRLFALLSTFCTFPLFLHILQLFALFAPFSPLVAKPYRSNGILGEIEVFIVILAISLKMGVILRNLVKMEEFSGV